MKFFVTFEKKEIVNLMHYYLLYCTFKFMQFLYLVRKKIFTELFTDKIFMSWLLFMKYV